jgi:hypothetical protein
MFSMRASANAAKHLCAQMSMISANPAGAHAMQHSTILHMRTDMESKRNQVLNNLRMNAYQNALARSTETIEWYNTISPAIASSVAMHMSELSALFPNHPTYEGMRDAARTFVMTPSTQQITAHSKRNN